MEDNAPSIDTPSDIETSAAVDTPSTPSTTESAPTDDLRANLTAAFDKLDTSPDQPEPSASRDDKGRFAKSATPPVPGAAPKAAGEGPAAGTESPTVPAAAPVRAPQSWRSDAKAHWDKLPPEVRNEVVRREVAIARAMQEVAPVRQFHEQFSNTLRPYEGFLRSQNAQPLQAIDNLFRTALMLNTAPPPVRMEMIAKMIQTYVGTDRGTLEAFDEVAGRVFSGQPVNHGPPPPRDPRVDQLAQIIQQERAERTQREFEQHLDSVEEWGSQREFFQQVRHSMADLMEVKRRQGLKLGLDAAYSLACRLDPKVAQVIQRRVAAQRANANQSSTQRAMAAASSIRSSPAGVPSTSQPTDLRGALSQNWDRLSRGR